MMVMAMAMVMAMVMVMLATLRTHDVHDGAHDVHDVAHDGGTNHDDAQDGDVAHGPWPMRTRCTR